MEYINNVFGCFDKYDGPAFEPHKFASSSNKLGKNCHKDVKKGQLKILPIQNLVESTFLQIHEGSQIENWGMKFEEFLFIGVIGKNKSRINFSAESYIFEIGAGLELNSLANIQTGRLDHIFSLKWNYLLLISIANSSLPVTIKIQSVSDLKQMLYFWEIALMEKLDGKKASKELTLSRNRVTVYKYKDEYWVQLNSIQKTSINQMSNSTIDTHQNICFEIDSQMNKQKEIEEFNSQKDYIQLNEQCPEKDLVYMQEGLLQNYIPGTANSQDQFELFFRIDRFQGIQQQDQRRLSRRPETILPNNQVYLKKRGRSKSFSFNFEFHNQQSCSTDGASSTEEIENY